MFFVKWKCRRFEEKSVVPDQGSIERKELLTALKNVVLYEKNIQEDAGRCWKWTNRTTYSVCGSMAERV
jgi:hypothetical protein